MASLVEIKGNYYLQFYDGNKSPSQKKVSLGTKRKRVAQKLKRKYEDAYALGEYDPWTGKKLNEPDRYLDVREALKLFLKEKRQAGLAESSIGSYKGIVERSGVLELPVDSVQKSDLVDFVYDSEVAKATRHKRYRHLRAFFNWCEAENYVQNPPDMEEPETYERLPKAVHEEELERVCDAIRTDYEEKRRKGVLFAEGQLVWRIPMFWFAFYTGLRASEIGRLRWRHIRLKREEMEITEQKNKNADILPLSDEALSILHKIDHRRGYIFVSPQQHPTEDRSVNSFRDTNSRAFTRYRKAAGIERPLTLHGLRHGFCSRLAEKGASAHTIQRLARHDSIESSMKYIHLSNRMLKEELDEAF
jgi:integrase